MTPEQAALVLAIVSQLDDETMTGEWPEQKCRYCTGHSEGYYNEGRYFAHTDGCVVLKIKALQDTMRGE